MADFSQNNPWHKRVWRRINAEDNQHQNERLLRYAVLAIVWTVVVIVISFYFFQVGLPDSGIAAEPTAKSAKVAAWGQFGDYMGGALNPIFGFFTVILLLVSIKQQREELHKSTQELRRSADANKAQLDHWEEQAKKDEIFRLIEMLSRRIDERMYEEVIFSEGEFGGNNTGGLSPVLHQRMRVNQFLLKTHDLGVLSCHYNFDGNEHIRTLRYLADDFTKFTDILSAYGKLRESGETIGYYWARYLPYMRKLLTARQIFNPILLGEPHFQYDEVRSFWYAINEESAHIALKQTKSA